MKNTCPHYFANKVKILLALGLAVLCMLTLPGTLKAQSIISGDIAGTVTDPSGAAVPGATVTVTSRASGATKTLTTNGAGSYRMPLLEPGDYTLVVKATGFESASETVTVTLGTVRQSDIKLTVGSAA